MIAKECTEPGSLGSLRLSQACARLQVDDIEGEEL
jgi:hypothetical protein